MVKLADQRGGALQKVIWLFVNVEKMEKGEVRAKEVIIKNANHLRCTVEKSHANV